MATLNPNVTATCDSLDADAVREIIDTDKTDAQINNFINFAYFQTLPLVGKLGACGGTDALCQIMLMLSAHFLTMWERQTKSEAVAQGEWSVTFMAKDGLALNSSLYGQNAITLDCSGSLAKAGLKQAQFAATTYYDFEESGFNSDLD